MNAAVAPRLIDALLVAGLVGCGAGALPPPAMSPASPPPSLRFQVLGNASPSDTGAPTLIVRGTTVMIRGLAVQDEGSGLYGDLDVSEPRTLRLTLYDSVPGRPLDDPPPPAPPSERRQVVYEALIGPVAPGGYDVWVGRFDARARLVEIAHEPLHIDVAPDYDAELGALGAAGPPVPELLSDGGRLAVTGTDEAHAAAIRRVLERVAAAYRLGDFRWPRGKDAEPHGTSLLAERGERVRYTVEARPRGGAIRFRSGDPEAASAVQDFLTSRRADPEEQEVNGQNR